MKIIAKQSLNIYKALAFISKQKTKLQRDSIKSRA